MVKLLVVEDDPLVSRIVARLLRRAGHDVITAACLADTRTLSGTYDCGIFDVDLPDGSGIDLAEAALSTGLVQRAVFFSDVKDPELVAAASQLGKFVAKSEMVERLLQVLGLDTSPTRVGIAGLSEPPSRRLLKERVEDALSRLAARKRRSMRSLPWLAMLIVW